MTILIYFKCFKSNIIAKRFCFAFDWRSRKNQKSQFNILKLFTNIFKTKMHVAQSIKEEEKNEKSFQFYWKPRWATCFILQLIKYVPFHIPLSYIRFIHKEDLVWTWSVLFNIWIWAEYNILFLVSCWRDVFTSQRVQTLE